MSQQLLRKKELVGLSGLELTWQICWFRSEGQVPGLMGVVSVESVGPTVLAVALDVTPPLSTAKMMSAARCW